MPAALALRQHRVGVGERLDDALFGGWRLRRGTVGHRPPEAQGGPLAVIGMFALDIVEAGGGVMMLDGDDDLRVAAAQIQGVVALRRAARASRTSLTRAWWTSTTAVWERRGRPRRKPRMRAISATVLSSTPWSRTRGSRTRRRGPMRSNGLRDRKGRPDWQSVAPPQRDRPAATVVYFCTAVCTRPAGRQKGALHVSLSEHPIRLYNVYRKQGLVIHKKKG